MDSSQLAERTRAVAVSTHGGSLPWAATGSKMVEDRCENRTVSWTTGGTGGNWILWTGGHTPLDPSLLGPKGLGIGGDTKSSSFSIPREVSPQAR